MLMEINIVTLKRINRTEDLSPSLESCNYLFIPNTKDQLEI